MIKKIFSRWTSLALAALMAVSLFTLSACSGDGGDKKDTDFASSESPAEASSSPEQTAPPASVTPSTREEVEEMANVADALDSGDFPYTVILGPGWAVKAAMGGAVIAEKENGLTFSLQNTIYGEEGMDTKKLEEIVNESEYEPFDVSNGKCGDYDAVFFKTTKMSDEGMPYTRVAYVIAENDAVVAVTLGAKAGENSESISFNEADIDAAFPAICDSFKLK